MRDYVLLFVLFTVVFVVSWHLGHREGYMNGVLDVYDVINLLLHHGDFEDGEEYEQD